MEVKSTARIERSGFTLIELLVVIALVGLLLALILPAVMQSRESSRRLSCSSNLRQIGIALHNYESTQESFPNVGDVADCLYISILPYVDQQPLYEHFHEFWSRSVGTATDMNVPTFVCPSEITIGDPHIGPGYYPSYLINEGSGQQKYGRNGFDFYPSLRAADITDGLSQTAALCEKLITTDAMSVQRLGFEERRYWSIPRALQDPNELDAFADSCLNDYYDVPTTSASDDVTIFFPNTGYNHILPPNSPSCWNGPSERDGGNQYAARTANSLHHGGVNLLLADSSCRFISDSIDRGVWRAVGSRNGNETIGPF